MSRILAYRAKVLSDLKALFPAIKDIEAHNGRFEEADIGRLLMNAPALRLAYLGAQKTEARVGGGLRTYSKFGCFIATKDTNKDLLRDAQAIGIGEALMAHFDRDQPMAGQKTLSMMAENLRHDILYSDSSDKKGILLSAVSWDVGMTLGQGVFEESGAALKELYVGDDLVWERPT